MNFPVVRLLELPQTQPSMNPFATLSSTKTQTNNLVLKSRKGNLTAVVFHLVAAVQEEYDTFKT